MNGCSQFCKDFVTVSMAEIKKNYDITTINTQSAVVYDVLNDKVENVHKEVEKLNSMQAARLAADRKQAPPK